MKRIIAGIMALFALSFGTNSIDKQNPVRNESVCEDENECTNCLIEDYTQQTNDDERIIELLNEGGIYIVMGGAKEHLYQDENMTFSAPVKEGDHRIATLYYKYESGVNGIYVIDSYNCEVEQIDTILTSSIETIKTKRIQNRYSDESFCGSVTVTKISQPKARIYMEYDFYTVQNTNSKDYYIVKSTIFASPGAAMVLEQPNYYQSKYKGLQLSVDYGTPTSSVTLKGYGPYSGNSAQSSYSVDLGAVFDLNEGISLGATFSYTRTISDTEILANGLTKKATWELNLSNSAREYTCAFEPGIVFQGPENKTYIDFTPSVSYKVKSWDTFAETITDEREIRVYPADVILIENN